MFYNFDLIFGLKRYGIFCKLPKEIFNELILYFLYSPLPEKIAVFKAIEKEVPIKYDPHISWSQVYDYMMNISYLETTPNRINRLKKLKKNRDQQNIFKKYVKLHESLNSNECLLKYNNFLYKITIKGTIEESILRYLNLDFKNLTTTETFWIETRDVILEVMVSTEKMPLDKNFMRNRIKLPINCLTEKI